MQTRQTRAKHRCPPHLSRKGKNASDTMETPPSPLRNSCLSASVSAGGSCCIVDTHAACSLGVMSPSMYRTRALTRSTRLTPALKGRPRTLGCCRRNHTLALRAASLTQSTRDCWPAPMPIIWPPSEKPTLLLWVYLMVARASRRSSRAASGSSWVRCREKRVGARGWACEGGRAGKQRRGGYVAERHGGRARKERRGRHDVACVCVGKGGVDVCEVSHRRVRGGREGVCACCMHGLGRCRVGKAMGGHVRFANPRVLFRAHGVTRDQQEHINQSVHGGW